MDKVYIFTGVETFSWTMAQFDNLINFCKTHKVDGAIVKVYEVYQGEWYNHLGYSIAVAKEFSNAGLEFIPYGFFYGGNQLPVELADLKTLLGQYPTFCLDLESDWDNNTNGSVGQLQSMLTWLPNSIWVSSWSNPVDHGWINNMKQLDSVVHAWLPQVYTVNNIDMFRSQYPKTLGAVFPVYTKDTVYSASVGTSAYWEYSDANTNPLELDTLVKQVKGGTTMSLQLNSQGMVLDVVKVNQLESGESQELCGNYGAAQARYAGLPGKGPSGSPEDVDVLADKLATLDNTGPVDEQGSTIQNMYAYFTSCVDANNNRMLHWQDIPTDVNSIKAALNAGYPVLVTANEQNIKSTTTGKRPPYEWNLNANHIVPLYGIDSKGNYISPDYLNDYSGTGDSFPAHYDSSVLQPSWASVLQVVGDPAHPWLAHIPSASPTTWPSGFNAQQFAQKPNYVLQQANDVWNHSVASAKTGSAIQKAWLSLYPTTNLGPPLSLEVPSVDWAGNPVILQSFCGYHIEFSLVDSKCRVYDKTNSLIATI